ncbi:hypothetical protein AJ78_05217 [Emergomyces pasteurianus Ep9510]|uniref:F-box domain-containing protein n=1 Tax=Emergomyces pasteurianus Ep9510 TaxID=1447872 RepID=A0A1J9PD52_9EURO|nr:hypothetical protein AJ78_05217 [Emergomyces pasteurianus Ep9510]
MGPNIVASISNLPPELLIPIFQLLDPASLVSLSQTNLHLRGVIQPTKLDFCERLLFFESTQQGGNTVPVYDSRTNTIHPECSNKTEWKSMLWACGDCLRLLPHTAFDNHRIFGLGYRKPIPGSPMVTRFTSWQPASIGRGLTTDEAWRLRHPGIENEIEVLQKKYRIAINNIDKYLNREQRQARLAQFQECGMTAFAEMSVEDFDDLSKDERDGLLSQEAYLIEFAHCGLLRHRRKCNECRYQQGELDTRPPCMGSPKTPAVRSRLLRCESRADRYLPGLARCLDIKNQLSDQPSFAVSPGVTDDEHSYLTTYMIRCPGCSTWKELHSFRPGMDWQRDYRHYPSVHCTDMTDEEIGPQETNNQEELLKWHHTSEDQEMFDDMRCNNCFVQAHGRREVGKIYIPLIEKYIGWQMKRLAAGIGEKLNNLSQIYLCPSKWRNEAYNITCGYLGICESNESSDEFFSTGMLSCYKSMIKFLNRTKNGGKKNNCRNWHEMEGQLDGMRKDYEQRMVQLEWIKDILPQVREPATIEKVVEWALYDTTGFLYF